MTESHLQPRANKARLDNRWGCSVGHAHRNFNPLPVSTRTAPAVPALERYAKKMDPTVSIYRRGSELIAVATGVTTMGVGFETGPGVRLSMDLPSDQIGQAITKLFADCGATVEHPKTFGGPDSPILRLSQAASWGEFMKLRPEHLKATLIGHEIVVEHWQRDSRGFSPRCPREQLSLAFDVPAQVLGDVVLGGSSKPTAEQVPDGNPH